MSTVNYLETGVTGTQWQRCKGIHITNEYGIKPHIRFDEEKILLTHEGATHLPTIASGMVFDAAVSLPVIDPDTNEPTGQFVTHAFIYQMLYSAYIQAATERDAQGMG